MKVNSSRIMDSKGSARREKIESREESGGHNDSDAWTVNLLASSPGKPAEQDTCKSKGDKDGEGRSSNVIKSS
jgi:hypothetical protein